MNAEVIPLGAQLRRRREELGLTQAQAARQLDVARTAYRLWEMEAARPSPDRWRSIAGWLGITVAALLLAGELLDESEAADLPGQGVDGRSPAASGDFFSQERLAIADQASAGSITADRAAQLHSVLSRIQEATTGHGPAPWHPGWFRKRLPRTPDAPAVARSALTATAAGVPEPTLGDAALLVSELVANSVRHTRSEWVDVAITVDATRLRVEVGDQSDQPLRPRPGSEQGGWGLMLVAALAHRWGVERQPGGKVIWVEFDLTGATAP